VELGKGPVLFRGPNINPRLWDLLCTVAEKEDIPLQHKGAPRGTPNDANALQLTRAGVVTAALGIPNRYMHTPVEMISLDDLDAAARLLSAFVSSTAADRDFTP
jgi:endoglucanase